MRRWHLDRPVMLRRWRQEEQKHLRWNRWSTSGFEQCRCSEGVGWTRKARPWDSYPVWSGDFTAFIGRTLLDQGNEDGAATAGKSTNKSTDNPLLLRRSLDQLLIEVRSRQYRVI